MPCTGRSAGQAPDSAASPALSASRVFQPQKAWVKSDEEPPVSGGIVTGLYLSNSRELTKGEAVDILERGNVYFFYRPKVNETDVEKKSEVQRFFMVLSPHGKRSYRLLVLGRKQLPQVHDGGQRHWGFVETVKHSGKQLRDELGPEEYETKTRGKQVRPEVRPAGEGVYALVEHEGHTHFAYELELPDKPQEVQEAFHIENEASYILSIKNPDKPAPRGAGLSPERRAEFPKKLKEAFRGRRFAEANPPEFLDQPGAEIMLIGAEEDVGKELGIDLNAPDEDATTAEIFNDLRLRKSEHPTRPLFEGHWA